MIVGGHLDSVPERRLARRHAQRGRRPRGAARAGARAARAHAQAGRLGRRGGRALRPQPARLERLRRHARPRGRARPHRPRRDGAARRARRPRRRARPHARVRAAALEGAAAYLELHIEQGPVLEQLDLPLGVVLGHVRRPAPPDPLHRRPRARRRDAHATCAATPSSPPRAARSPSATTPPRATTCARRPAPYASRRASSRRSTARCEISLDQRALDPGVLAEMLEDRARHLRTASRRRRAARSPGSRCGRSSRSRSTTG